MAAMSALSPGRIRISCRHNTSGSPSVRTCAANSSRAVSQRARFSMFQDTMRMGPLIDELAQMPGLQLELAHALSVRSRDLTDHVAGQDDHDRREGDEPDLGRQRRE